MSPEVIVKQASPQEFQQLRKKDLLMGISFLCFSAFGLVGVTSLMLEASLAFAKLLLSVFWASILAICIFFIFSIIRSFSIRRKKTQETKLWLAKINHKIVGQASVVQTEEFSMLLNLSVNWRYQNKGIGSQIVSHLISEVRKPIYVIALRSARRFYAKLGFVVASAENHRNKPGNKRFVNYPGMMALW